MSDPNLAEFYRRIARIKHAGAKGYNYRLTKPSGRLGLISIQMRQRPFLRVLIFSLVCFFGLKGAILQHMGAASYDARLARLETGQDFDMFGAWLMQADPVTVWVSMQIRAVRTKLSG